MSGVALSKFDNGSASFVERYSYSAFGETTVTLNGSTGNPYRFTGREYEPETGLYYYRARFYKPDIGRFLQPDPIGYDDGPNMYAYCTNNPTNFIDPSGLCKEGYGIGASLSGFGDAIAGRIGRFLTTSPKAHLKNFYSGLYGFGEMLNQSLYDIGADPGIFYNTLYDFGYHSNEILLNEFGNKTDYELGGMIGNLTLDAEIGVAATSVAQKLYPKITTKTIVKTRAKLGADGSTSQIIKTKSRITNKTLKVVHRVTKDGKVIHEHIKFP